MNSMGMFSTDTTCGYILCIRAGPNEHARHGLIRKAHLVKGAYHHVHFGDSSGSVCHNFTQIIQFLQIALAHLNTGKMTTWHMEMIGLRWVMKTLVIHVPWSGLKTA